MLQPELSQPKRAAEDVLVSKHAYVRVHVHPKRFPAAYIVDWKVGPAVCRSAGHSRQQPLLLSVKT